MSKKITMYPTKVTQPNRDKPSGLQGKCFKAVRRTGSTYDVNCRDQYDPKYHHEWSNAEEILKGRTIQCGRPSTHMCSHETYYGIKGYRNTCPLAGVTGTYTQPATLRLFFNLSKKNVSSNADIEKVVLSFDHRCTGVDVADGKEYTSFGPNFSGFNAYPGRKALRVKLGNEIRIINKNPPLSEKFGNTGQIIFKKATYKNLTEDGLDIIYGNNLEAEAGNLYIRGLKITVYYTEGEPYIEGSQNAKSLYISTVDSCRTKITFTIETGYKNGKTKIPMSQVPSNPRDKLEITTPNSNVTYTTTKDSQNLRKTTYTITDKTNTAGEKTVKVHIKGTKKAVWFKYKAVKRSKPNITIPSQIERNTVTSTVPSIIAKNGCANKIEAYKDKMSSSNLLYTFTSLDLTNQQNIIPSVQREGFYKKLASLPCGSYKIFFRRDNEPTKEVLIRKIKITPTIHKFKITKTNDTQELKNISLDEDKEKNTKLKVTYVKTKDLINFPNFVIENSTHGKEVNGVPTSDIIDNINWKSTTEAPIVDGSSQEFTVGTYYPGNFNIKIFEDDSCPKNPYTFPVTINSTAHKQYFDELFVRGEDSTAFDYDYLVALEGDSITRPLYVNTVTLGASFKDINICTTQENMTGLTTIGTFTLAITNNSDNVIENLFLELNALIKDEDNNFHVTSNEWLENHGIFYNFKNNFEAYNEEYEDLVSIKNLTPDDDFVDEEDVYIQVSRLESKKTIKLKIPYKSNIEKEVFLQILLFGQPMALYSQGDCNNDEATFDKISLKVYDSIATSINITGETDLEPKESECPIKCFETDMTYYIKNIDTNTLTGDYSTTIINDPRLKAYKIKYNDVEYSPNSDDIKDIINYSFDPTFIKTYNIKGVRVNAHIKFDGYEKVELHQYTDYKGEALFFITIPDTYEGTYNINNLLKYIYFEYEGNNSYNQNKTTFAGNTSVFDSTELIYSTSQSKDNVKFTIISDEYQLNYQAGESVPIMIKLEGLNTIFKNEIDFKPNIIRPGDEDSLTVSYRICNLENNKGKVTTRFKANPYYFIPNEISKTIYCGLDTNLSLYTTLSKVIVENQSLNRLSLSLVNKERDNKNVVVTIIEKMDIKKYDIINYELDKGLLTIEDDTIKWNIDYIDEDVTVKGYIDFKAKELGYSQLETTVKDFKHN